MTRQRTDILTDTVVAVTGIAGVIALLSSLVAPTAVAVLLISVGTTCAVLFAAAIIFGSAEVVK